MQKQMPILVAITGISTVREESQSLKWLQIPVLGNSWVRLDLSCISSKLTFKKLKINWNWQLNNILRSKRSLQSKYMQLSSWVFQLHLEKLVSCYTVLTKQIKDNPRAGCGRGFSRETHSAAMENWNMQDSVKYSHFKPLSILPRVMHWKYCSWCLK